MATLPKMFRISQNLEGPALTDVAGTIRANIAALRLKERIQRDDSIAITCGSRGINGIATIIKAVVDSCKEAGLQPYVIPAMGSHGGATAEGQRELIAHYGVTEDAMRCPIKSAMDVVPIGEWGDVTVVIDRNAARANHIAVVNRVKAHTDFDGEIESGLMKMMAIGLGKQYGAEHYHRAAHDFGYKNVFPEVGKVVLNCANVLFGLAVVENGADQTALAEAILPKDIYEREKELLKLAKQWQAKLPFDKIDVLIVDEIGKNISGSGMDPNVIGRHCVQKDPVRPQVRRLFVRDLTPESNGNAMGIGMADLITERLLKKVDHRITAVNTLTAGDPTESRMPLAFACDSVAINTALGLIGLTPSAKARVVRIKNTLHLEQMEVSEALMDEVKANSKLHVLSQPAPVTFDAEGNLTKF